ncbi:MAG: iron-sulfur cluster assembly scaffold protein [Candidatus Omnitrophica bacterium]|nr:iron-sulfur cluster assembly scaffold protein [Candidatus Omnitrophota bacterium]
MDLTALLPGRKSMESVPKYGDGSIAEKKTVHFGRMNAPTACSIVKGPCGDEMEFYLSVGEGRIERASFYTEGCTSTMVCGEMTAILTEGRTVEEAMGISPAKVLNELGGLEKEYRHCCILSVSALLRAIADYLLKP